MICNSPNRRNRDTSSAITGANRFPVGAPNTAQHNANATTTSVEYRGARTARGRTT